MTKMQVAHGRWLTTDDKRVGAPLHVGHREGCASSIRLGGYGYGTALPVHYTTPVTTILPRRHMSRFN